ncbi:MAG: hypothetical protein ACYS8W_15165 [Planctomycetota bacterium]|jgi:hypothetical protein
MPRLLVALSTTILAFICGGCLTVGGFHGQKWYAGETIQFEDLWQATDRAIRFHSGAGTGTSDLSGQLREVDRLNGYLETYHIPLDREHMGSFEYSRKYMAKVDESGAGWQVKVFVGQYQRKRVSHLDPEEKWVFLKREPDVEQSIIGTIQATLSSQYGSRMGTRKSRSR